MGKFRDAITGKKNISVIAEIKRYSPSYGKPFPEHAVAELVAAYEKGHAAAISVVTDGPIFKGSIELLREAHALTKLPLLRKDFITEKKHIDETVAAGASAVLLIAKNLSTEKLAELAAYAHKQGLDPLIETHTDEDLEKITELGTEFIIGINNRNLQNFSTDVHHAEKILANIDPRATIIIESAFRDPSEFAFYQGKIDAVLIGTALLISENPAETLTNFTSHAYRS